MQGWTLFFILGFLSYNFVFAAPVPADSTDSSPTSWGSTPSNAPSGTPSAPPSASSSVDQAHFAAADRPDPVPADRTRSITYNRTWAGISTGWSSQWSEGGEASRSLPDCTGAEALKNWPRDLSADQAVYLPPASRLAFNRQGPVRISSTPRCPLRRRPGHRCTKHCLILAFRQHSHRDHRKRSPEPEPIEFAHFGGGGLSLGPYGGKVIDGVLVHFNATSNAVTIARQNVAAVVAELNIVRSHQHPRIGARRKDEQGDEEEDEEKDEDDAAKDEDEDADGDSAEKTKSSTITDEDQHDAEDEDGEDKGNTGEDKGNTGTNSHSSHLSSSATDGDTEDGKASTGTIESSTSKKAQLTTSASLAAAPALDTQAAVNSVLPGSLEQDCQNLEAMYAAMGGASWIVQYGWDGNSAVRDQGASEAIAPQPVSSGMTVSDPTLSPLPMSGPTMSLPTPAVLATANSLQQNHRRSLIWRKRHGQASTGSTGSTVATAAEVQPTCCSWYGVTCSPSSRVTALDLANNGLSGSLAASVYQLNGLSRLNISSNAIDYVPDSFSGMSSLKTVLMDSLAVPGPSPLPITLQSLSTLVNIDASGNNFTGNITFSSGSIANVHLDNNQLTGLAFLGSLSSLLRVSFAGNVMQGTLPDLSAAMGLLSLDASQNKFVGNLFDLTGLTALTRLDVSSNGLTGGLPLTLANNPNLVSLDISRNGFIDSLPSETASTVLMSCNVMPNPLMTCATTEELSDTTSLASRCRAGCQAGNIVKVGSTSSVDNLAAAGIPMGLLTGEANGVNRTAAA